MFLRTTLSRIARTAGPRVQFFVDRPGHGGLVSAELRTGLVEVPPFGLQPGDHLRLSIMATTGLLGLRAVRAKVPPRWNPILLIEYDPKPIFALFYVRRGEVRFRQARDSASLIGGA